METVLAELKDTDPGRFAMCVSRFMPREDRLELAENERTLQVMISREHTPDEVLDLLRRCLQLAGDKPLAREHVVEAMGQRKER